MIYNHYIVCHLNNKYPLFLSLLFFLTLPIFNVMLLNPESKFVVNIVIYKNIIGRELNVKSFRMPPLSVIVSSFKGCLKHSFPDCL